MIAFTFRTCYRFIMSKTKYKNIWPIPGTPPKVLIGLDSLGQNFRR
jgi:hypothetical protein